MTINTVSIAEAIIALGKNLPLGDDEGALTVRKAGHRFSGAIASHGGFAGNCTCGKTYLWRKESFRLDRAHKIHVARAIRNEVRDAEKAAKRQARLEAKAARFAAMDVAVAIELAEEDAWFDTFMADKIAA